MFESMWLSIVRGYNNIISNADVVLGSIIRIALAILAAKLITVIAGKLFKRAFTRQAKKKPDSVMAKKYGTLITLLTSVTKVIVYFLMVVVILDIIGMGSTVGSLLATAGIGGVALGLGAQSFLKDILAGMFMLFEDEYAVGDYVQFPEQNIEGTVESISIRSTRLRLVNNQIAILANGTISTVVNFTRDSYLLFLNYEISADEDERRAADVVLREINDWLNKNDYKNGDAKYLGMKGMNSCLCTLAFILRLPPLKHWEAERRINSAVLAAFKKEGVKMPEYQKAVIVR